MGKQESGFHLSENTSLVCENTAHSNLCDVVEEVLGLVNGESVCAGSKGFKSDRIFEMRSETGLE